MQGNSTYITDPAAPDQEPRKFAFDFSYWSHDGFKELEDGYLSPTESHYADQVRHPGGGGGGGYSPIWAI